MDAWVEPSPAAGTVRAPASKSATIRTVACAALADGASTILDPSTCDDAEAALRIVAALGATVERSERGDRPALLIRGPLDASSIRSPVVVSCGESALCLRLYSAVAALLPVETELTGEGSLRTRPAGMAEAPLRALGVECFTNDRFPPVRVRGPMRGADLRVDASASSQFLTGLLVALPLADGDSRVDVVGLSGRGYMDMTLDTVRAFGGVVRETAARDVGTAVFAIPGGQRYRPVEYAVEGDWSGAAFMLVAGSIAGVVPGRGGQRGVQVTGLRMDSRQPDRAVLEALASAGVAFRVDSDSVLVEPGSPRAFRFDANACPDLVPPLVALASRCEGESRIAGVGRLRTKESDRAAALAGEFGKLGLPVVVDGDELVIRPGVRLRGGTVSARGDHRVAMALAVAGLAADGRVVIEGAECVGKSYPGFFADMASLSVSTAPSGMQA